MPVYPFGRFASLYFKVRSSTPHQIQLVECVETDQQDKLSDTYSFAAEVDATHIPVQQRGIGMVFQSYALFRHMTVAENITFGPRIQDLDIDEEERYCTCVSAPWICKDMPLKGLRAVSVCVGFHAISQHV